MAASPNVDLDLGLANYGGYVNPHVDSLRLEGRLSAMQVRPAP
jgi:hypothetical protein